MTVEPWAELFPLSFKHARWVCQMEENIDYLVTMLFTADQKSKGLIIIFIE